MSYLDDNLGEGEIIISRYRLHWMLFHSPVLYGIGGLFFLFDGMGSILRALGLGGLNRNLGFTSLVSALENVTGLPAHTLVALSFFFIAAISLYLRIVRMATTEIGLTNRRIMLKVGWLRTDAVDVLLDRIEAMYIQQSMFGKLFNYGSVSFSMSDGGTNFSWISDPFGFRREVDAQIEHETEGGEGSSSDSKPPQHDV